MSRLAPALSIFLCAAASPTIAQIAITAPPEVSALMAACTPTDAAGEDVVAGLRSRGWAEPDPSSQRAALMTLTAAHLWSFLPDRSAEMRPDLLDQMTDAVARALEGDAAFLTSGSELALILWDADSLSCLWAGPETDTVDTLAVQLGGPLPESTSTATRALNQRVEVGGRLWRRQMAVARTPAEELPGGVAAASVTDAARLDRSPE